VNALVIYGVYGQMGAERIVSICFAFPVLLALIYLALNPQSNSVTLAIVRFLAAIFAGIAGYSFTGSLNLQTSFDKTQVNAAGGFAAFVLVLLIFFIGIPQVGSSDNGQTSASPTGSQCFVPQVHEGEHPFSCETIIKNMPQQKANDYCKSAFKGLMDNNGLPSLSKDRNYYVWAHVVSGYCVYNDP
jgi:CDP-diglyceride synthetase